MTLSRLKTDQRGQAAIEFISVIVVVFFFLFFYLSLTITLVMSQYMDYVTFMTARTYKSGYSSEEFQERNAQRVFQSYVDRVTGVIHNPQLEFIRSDPSTPQRAGVVASYDVDLFYLPPLFVGDAVPGGRVTVRSEARLGRDPANAECVGFFRDFARRFNLSLDGTAFLEQMADNGC